MAGAEARTTTFDAPLLADAVRAIEAGERPSDRVLRGALRELRRIRRELRRRGASPTDPRNAGVYGWLAEHEEVCRWALANPEPADARLCSACRRRPAHFDDLCKRCGAATRPRGKVGHG